MNKITHGPWICKWVFLMVFLFVTGSKANAQFYAVKVDALGLCTTTLNMEGAKVIHNQWSIHLPVKFNPWKINGKRYQHTTMMPGVRYWLIGSYSRGWFLGANAVLTAYNHQGVIGTKPDYFSRDHRYKGWGYGAGVSGGYSLPMGKRWNIEFEVGVAGVMFDHDIYYEAGDGRNVGYQKGILFVPGKIGANLVYLF